MNKTSIEWTDYTWNPITGCLNNCSYCYARKLSYGRLRKVCLEYGDPLVTDYHDLNPFSPRYYNGRDGEPFLVKQPQKIFVCSMGELFGDWMFGEQQNVPFYIVNTARACPQHTFQFLTKYPHNLGRLNPWPDNAWVGVTATDQTMAETAVKEIAKVEAKVKFLSCEPLLAEIDVDLSGIDWLIIGSMTGAKAVKPELRWVVRLMRNAIWLDVPIFMKNNIAAVVDGQYAFEFRQEWPRGTELLYSKQ